MIKAVIYAADGGLPGGFLITSHGADIVCAAVSMLAINTVNSLETLTDCRLEYRYDKHGGYIECLLPGTPGEPESLLLRSLELGLSTVWQTYGGGPGGISISHAPRPNGLSLEQQKKLREFKR